MGSGSQVVMVREGRKTRFLGMLGWRRGTPRWADDSVVEPEKDDGAGGGASNGRRIRSGGSNK